MNSTLKTSLDTNILLTLWLSEPGAPALIDQLEELSFAGPLVVCAPVWVELCGLPGLQPSKVADLLGQLDVSVDFTIHRNAWELAAPAYGAYAGRRREAGGGQPRRLMADFLIGAHAATACRRLLTADADFYRRAFPKLTVVSPKAP